MTTSDWIQFGALFLALVSLAVQQWRQVTASKKQESRTANKLKIFYICKDRGLSEQELIAEYRQRNPTEAVDEIELRKTIYEMLADQTLRFRDDGTYKARRNRAASRTHKARGNRAASDATED